MVFGSNIFIAKQRKACPATGSTSALPVYSLLTIYFLLLFRSKTSQDNTPVLVETVDTVDTVDNVDNFDNVDADFLGNLIQHKARYRAIAKFLLKY